MFEVRPSRVLYSAGGAEEVGGDAAAEVGEGYEVLGKNAEGAGEEVGSGVGVGV